MPKDLRFQWPPGMIGNPTASAAVHRTEFTT